MGVKIADDFADDPPDTGPPAKRSVAARLVTLARSRYRFGVSAEGDSFALPLSGGHVVRPLRGARGLRPELAELYFDGTGQVAASQAKADALEVLDGMAQHTAPEPVELRVAARDGSVWLDLGDTSGAVVHIEPGHWQLETSPPVLFRRSEATGPFPMPQRGGDLRRLFSHLNVAESDRVLVVAWLVDALLNPSTPKAVLGVFGEQGTAKTTMCERLASLVDPSPAPLCSVPKDSDALMLDAKNAYVLVLDNLSHIQPWLSDLLCRVATGAAAKVRRLYTNDEQMIYQVRRPVILNGITLDALRGDLASRMVPVELELIPSDQRRTQAELAASWEADQPALFGALLDLCAKVLAVRGTLGKPADGYPRMADFAKTVHAVDLVTGSKGLVRLHDQAADLAGQSLEASPLVAALIGRGQGFTGTAAELLALLRPTEGQGKGWPASPRGVTDLLKRNAPQLRALGWQVTNRTGHGSTTVWSLIPPGPSPLPHIGQ